MLIEMLKAAVMGIVQGIAEWLPISSTGHMILVEEFMPMNVSPEFMEMFLVLIQLASVIAVIILYFSKLNPFDSGKTKDEKQETWEIWFKVVVGSIPVGIIGLLFKDLIRSYLYGPIVVAIALIVYGIAFIIVEKWNKGAQPKIETWKDLTYRTAFIIGMFQVLSLVPGTSRSGATIIGALVIGTARPVAAEFSFFLAIPAMLGASLLDLLDFGFAFTQVELAVLIVGSLVSFIVSVFAIKFLMRYIRKNDFTLFGWYRIVLGTIVLILAAMGVVA